MFPIGKKLKKSTLDTLSVLFFCVGLLSLLTSLFVVPRVMMSAGIVGMSDLDNYTTGGRMVLGAEKDLYNIETQKHYQEESIAERNGLMLPFRSPPPVALLFSFFAFFNWNTSYFLFYIFNLIVFLISLFLIYKFLVPDNKNVLVFYPFFWAVWVNLSQGQISILFLIVYLIIYYLMTRRGASGIEGIAASLLVLKPQLLVSIPFLYVVTRKKTRFLHGFLLSVIIIYFASALISEPGWVMKYIKFIFDTEGSMFGSDKLMYSTFSSFIYNLTQWHFSISDSLVYMVSLFLFAVVFCVFAVKSRGDSMNKAYASALLLSLPLAIHIYNHDLIYLIIPFYLILNIKLKAPKFFKIMVLVGIFLAPMIANFNSVVSFLVIFFSGIFLLFAKEKK